MDHAPDPSPAAAPVAPNGATKRCPGCSESVRADLAVCPHCRHRFGWDDLERRQPATRACPQCREEIRRDAKACPHCGTNFFTLRMRQFGAVLIIVTLVALIATCWRA